MPQYKVMYRKQDVNSGSIINFNVPADNVRSLARFLNAFVRRNPSFHVMAVLLLDENEKATSNVKFLQSEYASQRWLTGWKERLLANAVERYGQDLKWNSGLKQVGLVVKQ